VQRLLWLFFHCAARSAPLHSVCNVSLQLTGMSSLLSGLSHADLGVFLGSVVILVAYYIPARVLNERQHSSIDETDKQALHRAHKDKIRARSWLLSLVVSFVVSLAGILPVLTIIQDCFIDAKYTVHDYFKTDDRTP
jgi:hypothetical protein